MKARPLLESAPQNRRLRPTLSTHRFLRAATPSLAAIAASFAFLPPAHAQVDAWVAGNGNWSSPGNWSAGTLPTNGELVYISNTDGTNRTVNYDYTGSEVQLEELFVTNSGGGIDTLSMTTAATTPLASSVELIGDSGAGVMNQSAGTNIPSGVLILAVGSGDTGTYSLSGTGLLEASTEVIGDEGQGSFNQTGGTNEPGTDLYIGYTTGSTGAYSLSGGNLSCEFSAVGETTSGTFNQSGGTFSATTLSVADAAGSTGAYSLGSGSSLVVATSEIIGNSGNGSFVQTGGFSSLSGTTTLKTQNSSLELGNSSGVTGLYTLSGGTLSVTAEEEIGVSGNGTFNQSGGVNTIVPSKFALVLGLNSGGSGVYSLSSTGSLNASGSEIIGFDGSGAFYQTGGSNVTTNALILGNDTGGSGLYELSGGALSVTANETVGNSGAGTLIQTGGLNTTSGTLAIGSGSTGLYSLSSSGTLNVTGAMEQVGFSSNGTFIQSGGTNTSSTLTALGNGGVTGTYLLSGGSFTSPLTTVGYGSGVGTLNQSGGTLNTSTLSIGDSVEGLGYYTLSGSGSLAASAGELVANSGLGYFTQTGGTNSLPASASLVVGNMVDGIGTYALGGGSLVSGSLVVASSGNGSFTQSGGSNSLASSGSLMIGYATGAVGSYQLSGGSLTTGFLIVGDSGDATFTQTGGTMSVTGPYAAISESSGAHGSFSISAGLANVAGNLSVGGLFSKGTFNPGGAAALNVSGSANLDVSGILYATSQGKGAPAINLSGGTLTVAGFNFTGSQSLLNWTAGTLQITGQNLDIGPQSEFAPSLSVSSGQSLIEQFGISIEPTATLSLQGGNLTLLSSAALNNAGTFAQTSGSFTINGEFSNSGTATFGATDTWGPASVFVNLAGSATFNSALGAGKTGPVVVVTGGTVQFSENSGPSSLAGVAMAASGILDVTNNHLIINYTSGSDPIASIAGYIKSGFNAGAWNGIGIISSNAQSPTNGLQYGVGWADGADGVVSGLFSGQIELKYTLLGDANLDGTVNGSDFSILAANFGLGVTNWDQGNFLFGSSVNGSDFSALAANFGQGDSGADVAVSQADIDALDSFAIANGLPLPTFASVPEPASAGLLLAGIILTTRRRRRN